MPAGTAAINPALSVIEPTASLGLNRLRNVRSDAGRCRAVTSQPPAISCCTRFRPTKPVPPVTNAARGTLGRVGRGNPARRRLSIPLLPRIGVISQIRRQPALRVGEAPSLALRVARRLIAIDLTHAEIMRLRVREIKSADGRSRPHRKGFGQSNAGIAFRVEQLPEGRLLRMLGAGGIARGGSNSLVLFTD